jgi:hypothetical protein
MFVQFLVGVSKPLWVLKGLENYNLRLALPFLSSTGRLILAFFLLCRQIAKPKKLAGI